MSCQSWRALAGLCLLLGAQQARADVETSGNAVHCMVYFRIDRLGRVSDVRLEESSGVPFFDQSAVRAVSVASPLPPLPDAFTGATLGVHFGFQFNDR